MDIALIESMPLSEEYVSSGLIGKSLGKEFECTIIAEEVSDTTGRNSRLLLDRSKPTYIQDSSPTYLQRNIRAWEKMENITDLKFDCTVALNGMNPWGISSTKRLRTDNRIFWIQDNPESYLLSEDIPFLKNIYETGFAICRNQLIRDAFCDMFPELVKKCEVVSIPADNKRYQKMLLKPCEFHWQSDTADIIVVCDLECNNYAQGIPSLASKVRQYRSDLRWHIIGCGTWRDKLLWKIIREGVTDIVDSIQKPSDYAPLMAQSNGMLSLGEWDALGSKRMAQAMGKPILSFPQKKDDIAGFIQMLKSVKAEKGQAVFSSWGDRDKLIRILKGRYL